MVYNIICTTYNFTGQIHIFSFPTLTAGTDYIIVTHMVTIPAGESRGCATIPIINDTVVESNEQFMVTGTSSTELVADGTATVIIVDDDGQ